MNGMGAVIKVLPHLARPCDKIVKEVLAFVCIMLFNANEKVQVSNVNRTIYTVIKCAFTRCVGYSHGVLCYSCIITMY